MPRLPIKGMVVVMPSPSSQEDFAVKSAENDVTIDTLIANLQDPDQIVRIHAVPASEAPYPPVDPLLCPFRPARL